MWYESYRIGTTGPTGLLCCTLSFSVGLFRLIKECDVDLLLEILTLVCADKILVKIADASCSFPFNYEDSIESDQRGLDFRGVL